MAIRGRTISRVSKKRSTSGAGEGSDPSERKPQGRSPAFTVFVRIPLDLGEALERYVDETRPKPTTTSAVTLAIEELLRKAGFWPPPPGSSS
jgi:hypothetical protein